MNTGFTFEWRNEKGNNCRMHCDTSDSAKAWYWAYRTCGWDQRTTLKMVDSRGYSIENWWTGAQNPRNYNFFTLYLSLNLQDRLNSGFVKIVNK